MHTHFAKTEEATIFNHFWPQQITTSNKLQQSNMPRDQLDQPDQENVDHWIHHPLFASIGFCTCLSLLVLQIVVIVQHLSSSYEQCSNHICLAIGFVSCSLLV